jgi:hypothetical protein
MVSRRVMEKVMENTRRAADLDGSAVKLRQAGSGADPGDLHRYLRGAGVTWPQVTDCLSGLVSMAESSEIPQVDGSGVWTGQR